MNFANAPNNRRRHGQLDELRSIPFAQSWSMSVASSLTYTHSRRRRCCLRVASARLDAKEQQHFIRSFFGFIFFHRIAFFAFIVWLFCLFFRIAFSRHRVCVCVCAPRANEYSNSLEFDLFTPNPTHRNIDLSRIFIHIWFFLFQMRFFSSVATARRLRLRANCMQKRRNSHRFVRCSYDVCFVFYFVWLCANWWVGLVCR